MHTTFALSSLLLLTALSGCASLSENECLTADWESIGYKDGSRGYDAGRIATHTEACSEHGVRADAQQYEEGRQRGLELYCTSRNGARVGQLGAAYSGTCPPSMEPQFLRGYHVGRDLHEIETHMQRLGSEIQQTQSRLQSKQQLSDDERTYLIYRLRDLEREYGRAQFRYRSLEREARNL